MTIELNHTIVWVRDKAAPTPRSGCPWAHREEITAVPLLRPSPSGVGFQAEPGRRR